MLIVVLQRNICLVSKDRQDAKLIESVYTYS